MAILAAGRQPRPGGRSLAVGSEFRWETAGLDITSTVHEIDAPHRIVWGGSAQGIVAVHAWILEEKEGGVLVRTEESWEGEPVSAQVEVLQPRSTGRCAIGWKTSSAQPKTAPRKLDHSP